MRLQGSPLKPATLCLVLASAWGGCTAEPTKSQYVSSVVNRECSHLTGTKNQKCRIEVIKRFSGVSLEEMKANYPVPEPADRPSCAL